MLANILPVKKDRALGITNGRTHYDLPLQGAAGNSFLILLITLMTFLAVLALMAGFALSQITTHWSAGLENQITIEIPAETEEGKIRTQNEINILSKDIEAKIKDYTFITSIKILSTDEISTLIAPWLGTNFTMDDIPLPGLIALELTDNADIAALIANIKTIDKTITIDTHEEWLKSILNLISSLKFGMNIVTLVIAITGITAIAGAIRSRMAEHKPDVELLHLMGASDLYIAKQFQRYALTLGLKGGLIGLITGVSMILLFTLLRGESTDGLLPQFTLQTAHTIILALLPILVCAISGFTARSTVLRELSRMP
ncbi:MAG: cell division protein FtsX [Alphaproteobacteria bacterium]